MVNFNWSMVSGYLIFLMSRLANTLNINDVRTRGGGKGPQEQKERGGGSKSALSTQNESQWHSLSQTEIGLIIRRRVSGLLSKD